MQSSIRRFIKTQTILDRQWTRPDVYRSADRSWFSFRSRSEEFTSHLAGLAHGLKLVDETEDCARLDDEHEEPSYMYLELAYIIVS